MIIIIIIIQLMLVTRAKSRTQRDTDKLSLLPDFDTEIYLRFRRNIFFKY